MRNGSICVCPAPCKERMRSKAWGKAVFFLDRGRANVYLTFLRRGGRVGRRRSPAKRVTGLKPCSRVQIPPSPPDFSKAVQKWAAFCFSRLTASSKAHVYFVAALSASEKVFTEQALAGPEKAPHADTASLNAGHVLPEGRRTNLRDGLQSTSPCLDY